MKIKKYALWFLALLLCRLGLGASDEMCLLPEFQTIAQAESQLSRGQLENARQKFLSLISSRSSSIAARAAYRLAELHEAQLFKSFALVDNFVALLTEIQETRAAYLEVMNFGDAFWGRRAAYRLITLIDDSLLALQERAFVRNAKLSVSPFSFIFPHVLKDKALEVQFSALEKERSMLEESLLDGLKKSNSDPLLLAALMDRGRNGISLQFGEIISPPWSNAALSGVVTKQGHQYYVIDKDKLTKLSAKEAIFAMRMSLLRPEEPIAFAFALALLVDEKEPLPVQIVASALHSSNQIVLLSGLYAAQKTPSHELTRQLLSLWAQKIDDSTPFVSAQKLLYGIKERMLLALSSHFALGRESTQHILESAAIPDFEKAWLLQFRKDKNSTAYAQTLLQHKDALVRLRTQNAMRTWHS